MTFPINPISKILDKYTSLLKDINKKTAEVFLNAPEIPCKNKCFDCCKQLFPVSFVEAFYISEEFKTLPRTLRRDREKTAKKIHKKILAKNSLQFEKAGVDKKTALKTHAEFAKFLHTIESDCPALNPMNKKGACTVYQSRNHDCRTMGASFDSSANSIVGCFRFKSLGFIAPKMMDFYYRYTEKMLMDRKLIYELTGNTFTQNILYYTTMCGPILKDYSKHDWLKFFFDKNIPGISEKDKYWVVID